MKRSGTVLEARTASPGSPLLKTTMRPLFASVATTAKGFASFSIGTIAERAVDPVLQRFAAHPALPEERKIDERALVEVDGEALELVAAVASRVERGDDRARAAAGHDVGLDSGRFERLDDADVREAARAAAAEHERDERPLGFQRNDRARAGRLEARRIEARAARTPKSNPAASAIRILKFIGTYVARNLVRSQRDDPTSLRQCAALPRECEHAAGRPALRRST